MKNFLIFFAMALFFLTGCDEDYETKVTNSSDYKVTFALNYYREVSYTLKPHTSDYYSEYPFTIKNYSAVPPRVSYRTDSSNQSVTFYNTPARQIKILNELNRDVLVTAQGCMDNEPITVLAQNEFEGQIYTNNFDLKGKTTDGFPVNFSFSGNKILIHW